MLALVVHAWEWWVDGALAWAGATSLAWIKQDEWLERRERERLQRIEDAYIFETGSIDALAEFRPNAYEARRWIEGHPEIE